jgi:hypothetical protein
MMYAFGKFSARDAALTTLRRLMVACSLFASEALFLSLPILAQTAGAPTIIQHVASSANPVGLGISGNNFKIPLPNQVGSGNCLILGITYPHGSSPTITDSRGNSWPATPAAVADAGPGGNVTSVWVLPNAKAGTTLITVSFGSAIIPFNYVVSEFSNVATANPVSGTKVVAGVIGPSLNTGAFIPGNNDANGGNLIWNYYAVAGGASGNPTKWTSGASFTLLDADISWTSGQGFPHASQFFIQATSASISPTVTATGDASNAYNGVAIALKATTAGTSAGNGIHINKIIHQTSNVIPSTWTLQEPATGNLRVLATANGGNLTNIASITDSDGGTWTKIEPASDQPQIWYSANTSANPNLSVTIHITGSSPTMTMLFYDISGAAVSPFDVAAGVSSTNVSNQTVVNNMPSITPQATDGVAIAVMGLGQGPGVGLSTGAPVGAVFDLVTYTGEVDLDLMENADGQAHVYNTSTAALNWNWTITANPDNTAFATAAVFKALNRVTHDFNADGMSDIAWRDSSGNAAVWLMNGNQLLQAGGLGQADPNLWKIVGQRDFDGDGKADLLWNDTSSGQVAIWFMNGAQVSQYASAPSAPGWTVVGTGDFNGDGKGDILWEDANRDLAIWLMNGAQVLQAATIGTLPSGWNVVGTGDFNGDGKTDILFQNGGSVAAWFMNGVQVLQYANLPGTTAAWSVVGTGDFNGDGYGDILWRDTGNNLGMWLMQGTAISQAAGLGNVGANWMVAETGDFNGDGKSDILWRDTTGGSVAIWYMNGTAVLQYLGAGSVPLSWTIQGSNSD